MPRKLLFLLTDGGRARFVERSPATGDFVTIEEIDNTERLRRLRGELGGSPPAQNFASSGTRRTVVGRKDYVRPAKEAFMAEVAERAAALVRRQELGGVFVAAPTRLIGALRSRLEPHAVIAGELLKDLTKTPDHELHAWLGTALANPQLAR